MAGLAKRGWPVLYTSGLMKSWERGTTAWSRLPHFGDFAHAEIENEGRLLVEKPPRWLMRWPAHAVIDKISVQQHARLLARALQKNYRQKTAVLFLSHPSFGVYLDYFKSPCRVLYVHDAWWREADWTEQDDLALEKLTRDSDLIFAASDTMSRDLPGEASKRCKTLDHGVDFERYALALGSECPDDLKNIPHPRIGYVGRISRKVDLVMVAEIAARKPEWNWIFIGAKGLGFGESTESWNALQSCEKLTNVHFLGPRPYQDVANYMAHMDVNVMCYKATGGQWEAGNPLKLFEYLAIGKPVVGAPLENITRYATVVDIADSPDRWIGALEKAIYHGGVSTPLERQELAKVHDWSKKVNILEDGIMEHLRNLASN